MRTLIIHNPKSGFGSNAVFELERAMLEGGDECLFRMMGPDFTPKEAVADAEDFDCVVLSGGDGTVAGLLHALAGSEVPVCVFPSGTANLLFANIGNAPEPAALARACRVGATARMDVGEVAWVDEAGRRSVHGFDIMAGSGYDALIMEAAIPNKQVMGESAYFAAAFANPHPPVVTFTITVDGQTHERQGISCLVANTATIQNDIEVVPDSRMDDGQIEVIVLETSNAVQVLRPLLIGLVDKSGKAIGRPHIESFRGRDIHVEISEPMPLEVDGESVASSISAFDARVIPGACNMIVDGLSPYGPNGKVKPRFSVDDLPYPTM